MAAHEFEFVTELPPKDRLKDRRESSSLIDEFAAALQARPGVWAKWPEQIRSSSAGAYTAWIRQGTKRGFPGGVFDAITRNGILYVRYVGGEAR